MAKAKPEAALMARPVEVKVIHVPVVIGPLLQRWPREKIDVVPEFVDFRIAQLSDTQLVDQLGEVKKAGKDLEKWEKLAVDVLKGRMGGVTKKDEVKQAAGTKYLATLTGVGRRDLSKEKLIAKFGEESLEDCYKDSVIPTLKVGTA